MCLATLLQIPTEEHFQNIRMKTVSPIPGAYEPIWMTSAHKRFEKGHLYIDGDGDVQNLEKKFRYPCGWHYWEGNYGDKLLIETTMLPVLVADVVAFGRWSRAPGSYTGVAKMIYFLTDEEYKFLMIDHKPVHIDKYGVELEANEV